MVAGASAVAAGVVALMGCGGNWTASRLGPVQLTEVVRAVRPSPSRDRNEVRPRRRQQVVLQSRALSAFRRRDISRRASVLWPPLAELRRRSRLRAAALSRLYTAEYAVLRAIQKTIPLFTAPALAIHYCVSEEVLTLVLAASVWVVSLPAGATLVAFVTLNNLANGIVKWAVQRPRPPWHTSQRVRNVRSAWEKDLSFPSGHTQFFSGLLVCAATLAHPDGSWLVAALFGGALAGLSTTPRRPLCERPLVDSCSAPRSARRGRHTIRTRRYFTRTHTSVAVATALVGAAVGALALVRWAVLDVPPALAAWHANAVASPLSIQERSGSATRPPCPSTSDARARVVLLRSPRAGQSSRSPAPPGPTTASGTASPPRRRRRVA